MHRVLMGSLKERDHLESLGVDDRIILNMDVTGTVGWAWIGLIWLRKGQLEGCCEYGNEPAVSVKCGEFLD
jgi:hypothetical protein